MSSFVKASLASLLVAVPAPLVLAGILVVLSPELVKASPDTGFILLGHPSGWLAYLVAFLLFLAAGVLAAWIALRGTVMASASAQRAPASANAASAQVAVARQAAPRPAPTYAPRPATSAGLAEEGTVKWFNVKKGFGFISRPNGEDLFVHFRAIQGDGRRVLRQGEPVSYRVVDAAKGLQADQVVSLEA